MSRAWRQRERGVTLASAAGALLVIYLAADLGSLRRLAAWILHPPRPGREPASRRWRSSRQGSRSRRWAAWQRTCWTAVAFISIATACHQAWSANMFTVASDAFPTRVVGFGGMCGGIGGMLMLLFAGEMLQWLGNFTPLFIFAGVMHPLAWIAIRALVGWS
ncbi:MAG TPA: hypothetical protein VF179_19980 [Thermoanaerobaculia bacterium]|nr:hypothetical protein [Thermoanaerobaculia bacterium]